MENKDFNKKKKKFYYDKKNTLLFIDRCCQGNGDNYDNILSIVPRNKDVERYE